MMQKAVPYDIIL